MHADNTDNTLQRSYRLEINTYLATFRAEKAIPFAVPSNDLSTDPVTVAINAVNEAENTVRTLNIVTSKTAQSRYLEICVRWWGQNEKLRWNFYIFTKVSFTLDNYFHYISDKFQILCFSGTGRLVTSHQKCHFSCRLVLCLYVCAVEILKFQNSVWNRNNANRPYTSEENRN